MFTLPDLSVELIEAILQYLELKDHQSIRLVCSRLFQKGFRQSCKALFTEIAVEISRQSLEVLREISLRGEIASFVKKLRINVGPDDSSLGAGFGWTRQSSDCLEDTNEAIQMFREAIRQMKNVQHVEIISLEGPGTAEESFRACQGLRNTYPRVTRPDCLYMILRAFALEDKLISSFHIPFVPGDPPTIKGPISRRPFTFDKHKIPAHAFEISGQQDFRRNIRHLTLHFGTGYKGTYEFFQDFLSSIEALESLSLGYGFVGSIKHMISSQQCLGLKRLSLYSFCLQDDSLSLLLAQCGKVLNSLELKCITLAGKSSWLQLLHQLPDLLPSLEKISLIRLYDATNRHDDRSKLILFPDLEGVSALPGVAHLGLRLYHDNYPSEGFVKGVTYSGGHAQRALEFIAKAAVQT
ncbi:hypothetical protein BT63DRAFT_424967 [Microthyrium microscopicum]|uniref:F-box domain-containing protein n=1 Tax=Microthyrium microscopicum TaxID=703497 RepID=A0A6A6UDQ0_9PEZI|nr:hypothetical protein BT63DRAFT_424967 [Microthyrium microscopicum]